MKNKRKNFVKQLVEKINTAIDETPIAGSNKSPKDYRNQGQQFRESIEVDKQATQNVQKSVQTNKNSNISENDKTH